jgi:glycerol-3-phosphate dehydrogenase
VANRCRVVELTHGADGRIDGAVVDTGSDRIRVRASAVVSATGVWADEVHRLDDPRHATTLRPAKGVHVTVPWSLVQNRIAVIISVPKDKRSLFLVPWGPRPDGTFDHCYIGTTDTDHDGDLDDPQTDDADLDYVLRAVNHSLTTTVTRDDVTGVWAGLRPLVRAAESGRTADLSRRHRIDTGSTGLITVTGGKLTTYREMAEDTVDAVLRGLGRSARCRTRRLRLVGADGFDRIAPDRPEHHLAARYGAEAAEVRALVAGDPSLGGLLVPGLPYARAEAVFAVRHEMATTLVDVVTRRTRAHLQDRAACLAAAPDVARLLAPELGWDHDETAAQVDAYRTLCATEALAASGR